MSTVVELEILTLDGVVQIRNPDADPVLTGARMSQQGGTVLYADAD
jgi:hypothetical protein